jgi:DNA-binding LacI/PurR family transcriptional regulator
MATSRVRAKADRGSTKTTAANGRGRPATINDVARVAGVSIATVSRALNHAPYGVRAPVRRRVLKVAAALDYRPNALARSLLRQRTHTLGLLITDIANSFFAEITRGVADACRQRGYSLLICNTDRNPTTMEEYIGVLREKRVDGVLVMAGGTPGPQPFDEAFARQGIPVVVIGRFDVPVPALRMDNVRGGREAASHLIQLGHRQIGVILGFRDSTTSADMLKGHRQAFAEHGISLRREWVVYGDAQASTGLELARRLLRGTPRPTALLTVNDQTAIGAIRAALDLGLRVPADVSVVGFDGIQLGSFTSPALTTLRLPLHQMGVRAAEMLLRLGEGERVDKEVWVVPELTVRESTGPCPSTDQAAGAASRPVPRRGRASI